MANQTDVQIVLKLKDEVSQGFQRLDSAINKSQRSWVNFASQIFIAEKAFRLLVGGVKSVVAEAIKQEDAINRLSAALELQGTFTEKLSKQYQDLAGSIQKNSRFSDESVLEVMDTLVSLGNVAPASMQRVTQATIDFAAATGRDLGAAALVVAKASSGFTSELSRYGIKIDEALPRTERFNQVLKFLEDRFGGRAQRDLDTFGGQVAQLGNNWKEFLERLGSLITNSDDITESINKINSGLENMIGLVDTLKDIIREPFGFETKVVLLEFENKLLEFFERFGTFMPGFGPGAAFAARMAKSINESAMQELTALEGEKKFTESPLPQFMLPEIVVSAEAIKQTEAWADRVKRLRTEYEELFKPIDMLSQKFANELGGGIAKVITEGGKMKDMFNQVLNSMLQSIIAFMASEAVTGFLSILTGGLAGGIGGKGSGFFKSIGRIFGFAEGVQNFSGGLAVVGERGPELVNLPQGSDVIPNDRAFGGINVYINSASFNRQEDVERVFEQFSDLINEKQRG